jgi:hypothetical protein
MLPTPPRGDAVSVGYRPENVYLKRTSTSPSIDTCKRTHWRQLWAASVLQTSITGSDSRHGSVMADSNAFRGAVLEFSRSLPPVGGFASFFGPTFAKDLCDGSIIAGCMTTDELLAVSDYATDDPPSVLWLYPLAGMLQHCLGRGSEWESVVDRITRMLEQLVPMFLELGIEVQTSRAVAEVVGDILSVFPLGEARPLETSIASVIPGVTQRDELIAALLVLSHSFAESGASAASRIDMVEEWINEVATKERSANVIASLVNSWMGIGGLGPSLYAQPEFQLLQSLPGLQRDHYRCARSLLNETYRAEHCAWLAQQFGA